MLVSDKFYSEISHVRIWRSATRSLPLLKHTTIVSGSDLIAHKWNYNTLNSTAATSATLTQGEVNNGYAFGYLISPRYEEVDASTD